ncbi:MAG: ROK family protein [Actinomycetes bacterium]
MTVPVTDGCVLALDVGGTKIAAALVGPRGELLRTVRAPTPVGAGPAALFELVLALLRDVAGYTAVCGVGVGCGGPMLWPAGVVSPLNIPDWQGFPLRAALAEYYPGIPVRLHNDALCVAVAEHWAGAGVGSSNVLGMVVSTGVGGGLVLDGRLIVGASGNAGHVGHVVVEPGGPPCSCGGFGCLEAVASGPSLVRWALQQGWQPVLGAGERADARRLAGDAAAGAPVAVAAFSRAGWALGVGIASVVALTDVEVVSVGGGVAQVGPLLFEPLGAAYARHAGLDFTRRPRVVAAALGQDAGLVGAAALVLAGSQYWTAD